MWFIFGFFVGVTFIVAVEVVALYVLNTHKSQIKRTLGKLDTQIQKATKEPVSIIKSKTPESEAWEAIKAANAHRAGVFDSELK